MKPGKLKARIRASNDAALVESARRREAGAFRSIMKRHNQRLYRVARGVLGDDSEAEDVVQQTYLIAFEHLSDFRAEATLSTWLTRIALNEALSRVRRRRPILDTKTIEATYNSEDVFVTSLLAPAIDPEAAAAVADIRRVVEIAIDALPESFRIVFVMRDIEEMSIEETAVRLGLRPQTVKTRLHRARKLLREVLHDTAISVLTDTFPFGGDRCDRLTLTVLTRLNVGASDSGLQFTGVT
jgi:RNA polymerase sigma-70 factor (ECF subfamily)